MGKKKNKTPKFTWNEETGEATCIITDGTHYFTGVAKCHPEDMDMKNKLTGFRIAQLRAENNYYIHMRDNDILPCHKMLKHLYNCMEQKSDFDKNCNEARLTRRKIQQNELDLILVKEMLADNKKELKSYLAEKDKFYRRIRANRQKD